MSAGAVERRAEPDFHGQVAVVTGGGTGLGLEISRGLAGRGAEVAILSRNSEHHRALLEEGERECWQVSAHVCDVRAVGQVEAAARAILARSGRVDILVNNAAGNFVCPAERLSANGWRAVLGIVLDGSFYCSREFGRAMIERADCTGGTGGPGGTGGQILNILATYAWTGMSGVVHSASAKAGVWAMTRTLAAEWARHGIRVNAIAPGPFESEGAAANLWPAAGAQAAMAEKIPLGRFATAAEIAGHCLYLLSPACAWMTGECLVVDGGISLPRPMWDPGSRVERAPRS